MNQAIAYNPNRFRTYDNIDVQNWLSLFDMISFNVTFIDRTDNIKLPILTTLPNYLKLPVYDPNFSMTYEQCCQLAVQRLLDKQERLDVPIRLLYSGGIDSSLVLASFIKQLGQESAQNRIELVMSMESIEENPWMWNKIIRRSKFKILNGEAHSGDWDTSRILVGGEFNDQLFGSDIFKDLVRWRDDSILSQPWTESLMTEYHLHKGLPIKLAEMWTEIFSQHLRNAPCEIKTVADWWWWVNITCKWSSVYFRILTHARNYKIISQDYLETYYCQFYGLPEFQKWSMIDRHHKHQGTWLSYKWHARQLVSDFLGDNGFSQKLKRGSLWVLLSNKNGAEIIDQSYQYHWNITPSDWYNEDNSFRRFR